MPERTDTAVEALPSHHRGEREVAISQVDPGGCAIGRLAYPKLDVKRRQARVRLPPCLLNSMIKNASYAVRTLLVRTPYGSR
jgi:hypothetical protein